MNVLKASSKSNPNKVAEALVTSYVNEAQQSYKR